MTIVKSSSALDGLRVCVFKDLGLVRGELRIRPTVGLSFDGLVWDDWLA
jgi:hypothetical protein